MYKTKPSQDSCGAPDHEMEDIEDNIGLAAEDQVSWSSSAVTVQAQSNEVDIEDDEELETSDVDDRFTTPPPTLHHEMPAAPSRNAIGSSIMIFQHHPLFVSYGLYLTQQPQLQPIFNNPFQHALVYEEEEQSPRLDDSDSLLDDNDDDNFYRQHKNNNM